MKPLHLVLALCGLVFSGAIAEDLRLKDGTVLHGRMIYSSDSVVVFLADNLGELRIRADKIDTEFPRSVEARAGREQDRDPSSQALFFLPTAFNPPRNAFTFRDFEMLFLTFGYSPTGATTLSAGFLFPLSSDFQLLTVGFKQQLWWSPDGQTAVAVTGNLTRPYLNDVDFARDILNGNLVVGKRFQQGVFKDAMGIHGAVGYSALRYREFNFDGSGRTRWVDNFSLGAGFESRISERAKFMIEYLNSAPFDFSEEGVGLLTLGFRLHGARLSADIAGFRPVGQDVEGLFLWPLLNIGYRF